MTMRASLYRNVSLKLLLSIMCCILFTTICNAQQSFNGDGSMANPYLISSITDLQTLSTNVNSGVSSYEGKYFKMTSDIDFSSIIFTSIGTETNPFKGSFDGDGFVIKHLTINNPAYNYIGLFGYVNCSTSVIKNIGIDSAFIKGQAYVGAIGGYVCQFDSIYNCYVTNSIVIGQSIYIGGVCGLAAQSVNDGGISHCYTFNNKVSGYDYIGGISGSNTKYINNSYINIPISSRIDACYTLNNATKTINTSNIHCGPLSGFVNDTTYINSSYFANEDVSNIYSNQLGEERTSQEIFDELTSDVNCSLMCNCFAINNLSTNALIRKKDIDGKHIVITGQALIPSGYVSPIPSYVTITDSASLIDNANIIDSAMIETKLKVEALNLFGPTISNNIIESLNNNKGISTNRAHYISIMEYNYDNNNWAEVPANPNDVMANGEGLFVYPYAKDLNHIAISQDDYITVLQKGKVFRDDFSITKHINESSLDKPKLVILSNPYTSTIKADSILSQTSDIQGGILYIYNSDKKEWQSNLDGIKEIKPSQGFVIATTTNDFSINFKRPISYCENVPTLASASVMSRSSLMQFKARANNIEKTLYANLNENAENIFDNNDAYIIFSPNNTDLVEPYFTIEDKNLCKNEFKSLPYSVPLNFRANKAGNVEFTASNIPSDIDVSVLDLTDSSIISLNHGETLRFYADKGDITGRFVLQFKNDVSIRDNAKQDNISISLYPNPANEQTTLQINNLNSDAKVIMTDVAGRIIKTDNIAKGQSSLRLNTSNLSSGIYYIKISSNSFTQTKKLIVK
ncbi:MAG: T9SS type A sorting domain-containing protein [Bacteroidales bacterium]|nr:T9SS type A sorting domain-containing protein [Bacteroidales bacterium]